MLEEELKQLENEEHQRIMAGAIKEQRKQYLMDHPEILEDYRKGNFSTKGYHRLQQMLKFGNKREVQEFLQKIINEHGEIHHIVEASAEKR